MLIKGTINQIVPEKNCYNIYRFKAKYSLEICIENISCLSVKNSEQFMFIWHDPNG